MAILSKKGSSSISYLNHPLHLPDIERVEILVLTERGDDPTEKELLSRKHIAVRESVVFWVRDSHTVANNEAQEIADLWRNLPYARQMRCHVPRYALRFFNRDQLILEATMCWDCNNIWTKLFDNQGGYTFNAKHEISQRLLNKLKELAPL